MTNELEKQFFGTIGMEPIKKQESELVAMGEKIRRLKRVEKHFYEYPQITDRILLKLICIVLNTIQTFEVYRIMDIDSLKEKILKLSMLAKNEVYSEVRTLFEEG